MRKVAAFVRLSRPLFLAGGALAYGLGAVLADAQGAAIESARYLLGQALVTSVQLTAQYANEHFDAPGDRVGESTWFSGGSGVLPAGLLPQPVALRAASVTTVAALALVGAVAATSGPVALLGLAALAGAWAYSAPPIRLAASGTGEIAVSVIVGAVVPLAGLWMNGGQVDAAFGWMVLALVAAHFAMIMALSVPDRAADRASGKRSLAVRVDTGLLRRLHAGALATTALALVGGVAVAGIRDFTGLATLAALPPAVVQWAALRRGGPAQVLTSAAVATFAVLAATLLGGTLFS